MSQAALSDAIYDALAADQSAGTLYDDLGGRLFHLVAPSETDLPLMTWQFVGEVPVDYFSASDDHQDVSVQFDIYTNRVDGPNAHDAIRAKAHTLLHRVTLTATGFGLVDSWIDDRGGSPISEDDALRTTMTGTLLAQ